MAESFQGCFDGVGQGGGQGKIQAGTLSGCECKAQGENVEYHSPGRGEEGGFSVCLHPPSALSCILGNRDVPAFCCHRETGKRSCWGTAGGEQSPYEQNRVVV